jgi:Mg/Co/Ni transporter MgtE
MVVLSNAGKTYGKEIGASALTSILWGFALIIYDYFNGNDWLFPFVKGFSLATILTVAFLGTLTIILLSIFVFAPSDVLTPQTKIR